MAQSAVMSRSALGFALAAIAACVVAFVVLRRPAPSDATTEARPSVAARPSEPNAPAEPKPSPFAERDRAIAADEPIVAASPADATPPAATPPVTDGDRQRREEPTEPAAAPPVPPQSTTIAESTERATVATKAALDAIHKTMRRKCWDTLADPPDRATIGFSVTYDATGKVIASAVQQGRDGYRNELGTCLAGFAHGLTIEPPGETVSLDVSFDFP